MDNNNPKSPEQLAQEVVDKAYMLSSAYARLFNTSDGLAVLGDLNGKFLINNVPDGANHAYWNGAKSVMTYIYEHQRAGAK